MESAAEDRTKSRPLYSPIVLKEKASCHVFIAQKNDECDLLSLFEKCQNPSKKWLLVDAQTNELEETLSSLPFSSQLYLAGCESFMWDVHNLARKVGLLPEQISFTPPQSNVRRVFCTHCYTLMEQVYYTPVTCDGCERPLLVRDHFSRVHGAYVGLNINAEDVNDVPEQEALR